MPLARLPITGSDANTWSDILNRNITQTNSALNGAFNSFDQFSGRPTNLTVDDTGKTYLYTQTGNWHEWSGTEWKVQNKSEINVKDYGAVGDFNPETGAGTDDTSAIQPLLERVIGGNSNKSIFFPEGSYGVNLVFRFETPNILGQGNSSTKISSYTNDGYAFTYTRNYNWVPREIKDLEIIGNTALTRNGIQLGPEIYGKFDEQCNGLRAININFVNLNIAILKRYGNIGNSIEHCNFTTCNYHYKAIGYGNSVTAIANMHTGCDTFYKCQLDSSKIASIYVDGRNVGINGMHIIRDCIFEYNLGYAIYVKNYDNENQLHGPIGFIIENCWFEDNAQSAQITIDNTLVTPRNLYFNTANATFVNSEIANIELIHSRIICKNSGIKSFKIGSRNEEGVLKDNFSSIIFEGVDFVKDVPFYVKNPLYIKQSIPTSVFCISAQRNTICYSDKNIIYSDSYSTRENIFCLGVSGVNVGKLVRDGTLFGRSLEIDINGSNNNQDIVFDSSSTIIIPKNKYIFWSVDVKKISGDDISMFLLNATFTTFTVKSLNWTTLVGLGDTIGSASDITVNFVMFTKNLTTKFRLTCLQILAFDTLQELHEYVDSLKFTIKTEKLISSGLDFPSMGNYNKGDLIYNSNPTSGGYVGWICTTAGAPGTWKGFGLIEN